MAALGRYVGVGFLEPELLNGVPLFAEITPATRAELAATMHVRHYRRDMFIFVEGEPGEAFHVLLRGAVRIFRSTADGHEQTLDLLGDGDVMPLTAFLEGQPYPASALTLADSDVGLARSSDLARLVRTRSDLAWAFLAAITKRLLWAQSRIYDLALRSAAGRVASALLQLARERGTRVGDGLLMLDVPLTHRELGQLAGISRETVTRLLTRLRADDGVRWTDDGYVLINPTVLGRWLDPEGLAERG